MELQTAFWQQPGAKIGIVMTPLPEGRQYLDGQTDGALGVLAALDMTSDLNKQLGKIDMQRVVALPERFRALLAAKAFDARLAPAALDIGSYPRVSMGDDFAARDYAALGLAMQVDLLLAIELQGLGTSRSYSAFLPKGPPAGYFMATGQLIDLKTKKLLWQKQVRVIRSAQSDWEQPPDYPLVTRKVNESIDAGISLMIADFSWQMK